MVGGGTLNCLSLEAIFEELFVTRGNKVAQETGSERGEARVVQGRAGRRTHRSHLQVQKLP